MDNALNVFKDRRKEVDIYFGYLKDDDKKQNNNDLFLILKSSFILLLYNLVEATISAAIEDIYDKINSEECTYESVIPAIKKIWVDNIFKKMKNKSRAQIIDSIIRDTIKIDRKSLSNYGNFDDDKIRKICKMHGIKYNSANDKDSLKKIKLERNNLTHGIKSFAECSRDLSIQDLENHKNNVLKFIESILNDMKDYYDNRLFLSTDWVSEFLKTYDSF